MKIGIDCRSVEQNITGVGRYLINLLKYWQNEKDVEFFLYFKNKIPETPILNSQNFTKRNLNVKSNALFTHFFFPRAAKKDKIDILFSPGYILPIFWLAPSFLAGKGKSAVAIHDIYYEAHPDKFSWPSIWDKILLKWVSKKSAQKADLILTPSEFSKNEIIKYYKINPDKIKITPLAGENEFSNSQLEKYKLADYGLEKEKYLIYFASIFNRRHVVESINGFKMAAKKLTGAKFLIVGENHTNPFIDIDGIIKKANEDLNENLNGQSIIHLESAEQPLMSYLVKNARASIYLSDYEGFGLPPLESAACGVPAIITKKGSLGEVMADAGVYVKDPTDIKEIAGWIYLLFTDDAVYQILKEKGIDRAQLFSWKECAERTLKAIKKIESSK